MYKNALLVVLVGIVTVLTVGNGSVLQQSAKSIQSCYDSDLDEWFVPWQAEQLSHEPCSGRVLVDDTYTEHVSGWCVSAMECMVNDGNAETLIAVDQPCSEHRHVCCVPEKPCKAKSALGATAYQNGTCLKPQFCTAAASAPANDFDADYIDCGKDATCCTRDLDTPVGVQCPNRYTTISYQFKRVLGEIQQSGEIDYDFTYQRLDNFLPFTFEMYDYFKGDSYCAEMGDCVGATYWAFVYHLLRDITDVDPSSVLGKMQTDSKIPKALFNEIERKIESQFNGHITPEAFGWMVHKLWSDQQLNLAQYNTGSCSDWIRLSHAVLGPNAGWKCDLEWNRLITDLFCRSTYQSNLDECDQGKGICFQHGVGSTPCEKNGVAELTNARGECSQKYGNGAVCCAKKQVKPSNKIEFVQDEYHNVPIAINHNIEEDPKLIENIKETFTRASQVLYNATGNRAYFKT